MTIKVCVRADLAHHYGVGYLYCVLFVCIFTCCSLASSSYSLWTCITWSNLEDDEGHVLLVHWAVRFDREYRTMLSFFGDGHLNWNGD